MSDPIATQSRKPVPIPSSSSSSLASASSSSSSSSSIPIISSSSLHQQKLAISLNHRRHTQDVAIESGIDFSQLCLSPLVLKGLVACGYQKPSPIQLKAIPLGKHGLDLIAQAKSGTGKTCVFAVIALEFALKNIAKSPCVLIVAPTREIALQIEEVVSRIGSQTPLRTTCCIGGLPIEEDSVKVLSSNIVIGTPGRLISLIKSKALKTEAIKMFIMDEADRLMDGNFRRQSQELISALPAKRQTLAFSATFTPHLTKALTQNMKQPELISLTSSTSSSNGQEADNHEETQSSHSVVLQGVKQFHVDVGQFLSPVAVCKAKERKLIEILGSISFHQCMIFYNNHSRSEVIVDLLNHNGFPAALISGQQHQLDRIEAMQALRSMDIRVLVSTDLSARGIDVERVNLVINLDLPRDGETYLHRVGRTGRFGTYGLAISIVSSSELEQLTEMTKQVHAVLQPLPSELDASEYLDEVETAREKEAIKVFSEERQYALENPQEFDEYQAKQQREMGAMQEEVGEEEQEQEEEDQEEGFVLHHAGQHEEGEEEEENDDEEEEESEDTDDEEDEESSIDEAEAYRRLCWLQYFSQQQQLQQQQLQTPPAPAVPQISMPMPVPSQTITPQSSSASSCPIHPHTTPFVPSSSASCPLHSNHPILCPVHGPSPIPSASYPCPIHSHHQPQSQPHYPQIPPAHNHHQSSCRFHPYRAHAHHHHHLPSNAVPQSPLFQHPIPFATPMQPFGETVSPTRNWNLWKTPYH